MSPPAPGFRRRVRMGPGVEFDLIRSFTEGSHDLPPEVRVGPGDDCAVVEGGRLALTCDLAVEGIHFRRDWLTAEEIGGRSCAAALSDLAAVAAAPVAVLVACAAGADDVKSGWLGAVQRGVEEAARAAGAAVVGGDVARSPGPLVLDVTGVGRVEVPVLRDGARPGDELWVTGRLGAAGAAVRVLRAGGTPDPAARDAWARPRPRVAEARWLAAEGVFHALIDLSDGLGADAGHLAAASGVGVVLEGVRVPVAPDARAVAAGESDALELALAAGEDYELCFAAPPGVVDELRSRFVERFSLALTRVGRVVEGQGVVLDRGDGEPEPLRGAGYDHFAAGTDGGGPSGPGVSPGGGTGL